MAPSFPGISSRSNLTIDSVDQVESNTSFSAEAQMEEGKDREENDDITGAFVSYSGGPLLTQSKEFSPLDAPSEQFKNYLFEFDNVVSPIEDTIQYYDSCSSLENSLVNDCALDVYSIASVINSSPLRPQMFEKWLRRYNWYDKAQILYDLNFGVRIPSSKLPPSQYSFYNHPSVFDHQEKVSEMLVSRIEKGIVAGPFDFPPPGLIVSPLAAIPKKEEGKIRLIHNLSYPYGDSVNSNTPRTFCTVKYETLDDCLRIVHELGKDSLIAKADLCDAYNCMSMNKFDFKFLGFTWQSKFYFAKTLPMGASISCQQFERLSTAVQWILRA
ncbi:MAG: hypothetical protein GY702_26855, partial [Desulfobulbaceae bacterium]|nr:hypothetical protein [Desulfobulbaceae bacterium]